MLNNFIAEGFIVCFFSPGYSKELQQQILKKKTKKPIKFAKSFFGKILTILCFPVQIFKVPVPAVMTVLQLKCTQGIKFDPLVYVFF